MNNQQDKDKFPGYPHYPASEDITRHSNNNGSVPINGENAREAATRLATDNDADVTSDDIVALNAAEQNMDTVDGMNLQRSILDNVDEDGDPLNETSSSIDMTGEDLDVPGSSADDADEAIGEEDEENNYYSLGGDNHEAQEENKGE